MNRQVTFHRAATAEFVDASAWYKTKRVGLAVEFIADDRALRIAGIRRWFTRTFGV